MRKKDANPLENFDYLVECGDFLLYELGRLIDEDRASLDDEEFRRVVDEGIREHVETCLEVRAELAMRLRAAGPAGPRLGPRGGENATPVKSPGPRRQDYSAYHFGRPGELRR